jgi:hypothetical protein
MEPKIITSEMMVRMSRVARSFNRRSGGPFEVNDDIITIYNGKLRLGGLSFIKYMHGLYSLVIDVSPICYCADTDHFDALENNLSLLYWLSSLWVRPSTVTCPICHIEMDVTDEVVNSRKYDLDSHYIFNMLAGHFNTNHTNIKTYGLEESGLSVFLKTTLGNFEIENFYLY